MHLGVILSFSLLLVVSAYDRGGDANWRSLSRKRKDADTRQSGNRKGVTNGKGDNFDANGKNFMRWAEGLTRFSQGFPRLVAKYWRDVPSNVDAAMHSSDGFYYFFKGQRYWKYNESTQLEKGYPKDTRGAWLSCGTRVPRR